MLTKSKLKIHEMKKNISRIRWRHSTKIYAHIYRVTVINGRRNIKLPNATFYSAISDAKLTVHDVIVTQLRRCSI